MRSIRIRSALALFALCLIACTKGEIQRNVYEGARVYNESLKSTPLENPRFDSLSYEGYERERTRSSKQDASEPCLPREDTSKTCTTSPR